jgi:hypothetical protein
MNFWFLLFPIVCTVGAIRVMASCGLSYASNYVSSHGMPGFKPFENRPAFGAGNGGGIGFNPLHQGSSTLKLDPAIEDLVSYAEALAAMQASAAQQLEGTNNPYQPKPSYPSVSASASTSNKHSSPYVGTGTSTGTGNGYGGVGSCTVTATSGKSNSYHSGSLGLKGLEALSKDRIEERRASPSNEIRSVMSVELKKYLISTKVKQ